MFWFGLINHSVQPGHLSGYQLFSLETVSRDCLRRVAITPSPSLSVFVSLIPSFLRVEEQKPMLVNSLFLGVMNFLFVFICV